MLNQERGRRRRATIVRSRDERAPPASPATTDEDVHRGYNGGSARRIGAERRGTEVVVTGAPRKRLVAQAARGFESHPLRQSTQSAISIYSPSRAALRVPRQSSCLCGSQCTDS